MNSNIFSRNPLTQPTLFSVLPADSYDFQILVFLDQSPSPIFSKTFKSVSPSQDGTYVMTYSVPDHTLWNRPMRVIIVDLTSYKGNQSLLKMRLEYTKSSTDTQKITLPVVFKTKAFKTSDQRTIKLDMNSVYKFELHSDV